MLCGCDETGQFWVRILRATEHRSPGLCRGRSGVLCLPQDSATGGPGSASRTGQARASIRRPQLQPDDRTRVVSPDVLVAAPGHAGLPPSAEAFLGVWPTAQRYRGACHPRAGLATLPTGRGRPITPVPVAGPWRWVLCISCRYAEQAAIFWICHVFRRERRSARLPWP